MLTNLLYRAANKFRFHAPSTVTTLAYMAYRARGAYLQDGLITVHNSDFRKDQAGSAGRSSCRKTVEISFQAGPGVSEHLPQGLHLSSRLAFSSPMNEICYIVGPWPYQRLAANSVWAECSSQELFGACCCEKLHIVSGEVTVGHLA
jgi:hypothetical protein